MRKAAPQIQVLELRPALVWRWALKESRPSGKQFGEDLVIPVIAASLTACVLFRNDPEVSAGPALWDGLMVGLGTLAALYLFRFLSNLIRAPKAMRIENAISLGYDSRLTVVFEFRDMDIMQQESVCLTILIDQYLNQNSQERLEKIWAQRALFGSKAEKGTWLSRKNRKRSLALFNVISSTDDLHFIKERCLEFQLLKPLH